MRVVNGVVILSVLTISAWKCGQANAAPGFWDNDIKDPDLDTRKYFFDDKHNNFFEVKSLFTKDKVEFDNKQSAKDLDQDSVASEGGVFRDVRNQKTVYGDIQAKTGVNISTSQSVDSLKPHSHKSTDHAGHSTRQQEDHVPDYNQQRQSSDDFVQNVNQLVVFNASKNLQQLHVNGQTKRREDSSVTPGGHPDDYRQQTDQLSRPYGQSSYGRQNGEGVYNSYNRQQGSYAQTGRQPVNDRQGVNQPTGSYGQSSYDRQNGQGVYNPYYNRQQGSYAQTGRQPVNDRQGVNQPSGSYGQSSYDKQNGQGVYNSYNRQQGSYAQTGRQPVNDRQGVNQPSGSYGQSSYDKQNGQGVYNPYNRQQGSYAQSERPFANDRNTEQVNPNNDQSKNNGVNYIKDWDVYSSVPLTEVSSSDGHSKLVGTAKLPGGVSSVSIEKSPQSLDTSSVIKYGNLAPKGAVIISTSQQIGS